MAGDTIEIADVALDTSMAIWSVKITVEISDPVFKQAKALAAKDEANRFAFAMAVSATDRDFNVA